MKPSLHFKPKTGFHLAAEIARHLQETCLVLSDSLHTLSYKLGQRSDVCATPGVDAITLVDAYPKKDISPNP